MPKHKIIIVDDEVSLSEFIKKSLERIGEFEVHIVNNPLKALEEMRQFSPDVAVIDLIMCDKPGSVLIKEMKEEEELRHIPVLLISGMPMFKEMETICKKYAINVPAGGKALLEKPFTPEALRDEINLRLP